MLLRHPCRLFPSLPKARFVDHQDGVRIAQLLQNVGTQIVAHQIRVPGRAVEQALHPVWSGFSGVFGQLPAIFALDGTDDAFEIGQCSTTGFRASETRGNAGMQAFEFLSPPPDFDKGGFGSCRGDVLGVLHVLLLS
jgi:hypothetical protein